MIGKIGKCQRAHRRYKTLLTWRYFSHFAFNMELSKTYTATGNLDMAYKKFGLKKSVSITFYWSEAIRSEYNNVHISEVKKKQKVTLGYDKFVQLGKGVQGRSGNMYCIFFNWSAVTTHVFYWWRSLAFIYSRIMYKNIFFFIY